MRLATVFLIAVSAFADAPDPAKQLADAKAEVAALRQTIADMQAWVARSNATMSSAVNACVGAMPQPPAPKPEPKPK